MVTMRRYKFCQACSFGVNGVKSRMNIPHTCGKTDESRILKGLKDVKKSGKLLKGNG